MTARLILSEHGGLATPYSLGLRKRDKKEPAAELCIEIPGGKSSRVVTVDLNRDDLLLLAESSLAAIRVLDKHERSDAQP